MNLSYAGIETHPDGTGDINNIVNANWQSIAGYVNPAAGLTASQAGTALTASAPLFTPDDDGATVRFADGTVDTVAAYVSADELTMSTSQTVGSQAFEIYRTGESPKDALARGLFKRPRMLSSFDGAVPVWSHTRQRFDMVRTRRYETLVAGPVVLGSAEAYEEIGEMEIDTDLGAGPATGVFLLVATMVLVVGTGTGGPFHVRVWDDTESEALFNGGVIEALAGTFPQYTLHGFVEADPHRLLKFEMYNQDSAGIVVRDFRAHAVRVLPTT